MDEVIEKNGSNFARAGFIIVFFGMLTQSKYLFLAFQS
jgi:hypothetical protein